MTAVPHNALWRDVHRVDFWELLASQRGGTVLRKRRLLGIFQRENQKQLRGIASGLRKDYVGIRKLRWSARVAQRENTPAGCSKCSSGKAAASEDPETYALGYVEDLNDARTSLADFFSILLEEIADQLDRFFRRGSGIDEMWRELRKQTHPGLVGTQQNHGFLCLQRQRNF